VERRWIFCIALCFPVRVAALPMFGCDLVGRTRAPGAAIADLSPLYPGSPPSADYTAALPGTTDLNFKSLCHQLGEIYFQSFASFIRPTSEEVMFLERVQGVSGNSLLKCDRGSTLYQLSK